MICILFDRFLCSEKVLKFECAYVDLMRNELVLKIISRQTDQFRVCSLTRAIFLAARTGLSKCPVANAETLLLEHMTRFSV